MKTVLFISFFSMVFLASGQFSPQQIIDPDVYISKIVPADLDNDGFTDIIISRDEFNNSKISFYLNSGTGSFGPENIVTNNVNLPETIAAGDLDGNGWPDIVAASCNPNKLLWLPNSGGSFPTEIQLDSGFLPEDIEITDVDNDGNLDIVVLAHFNIIVYYNTGNGAFNKVTTPNDQFEYYAFSIADLDNDGFKDIIVGVESVLVYMNDNGSFTTYDIARSNSIAIPYQGISFMVHTADLDGNGSMDLIIENSSSEINWFANDGNGFFTFMQIIENASQCQSVSTGDFNNDGSLDLFIPLSQVGEVAWYANDGQGNFGNKQVIGTGNGATTNVTASADLDNNGNPDVIWAHPFSFNLNGSLGLESHSKPDVAIRVSPNPFKGQLLIQAQEGSSLTVFDIRGRKIYKNIRIEAGTQTFSSYLPPQLYFFEFTTTSQVIVKKILKE